MSTRDEVFRQFGPLLTEAIADFLLDNVNALRKEQGMSEIKKDDYLALLMNHLSTLELYDWMKETL